MNMLELPDDVAEDVADCWARASEWRATIATEQDGCIFDGPSSWNKRDPLMAKIIGRRNKLLREWDREYDKLVNKTVVQSQ
jgi:hypothetical protein